MWRFKVYINCPHTLRKVAEEHDVEFEPIFDGCRARCTGKGWVANSKHLLPFCAESEVDNNPHIDDITDQYQPRSFKL